MTKQTSETKTRKDNFSRKGHKKIKLYSWQNETEYQRLFASDVGFRLSQEQYDSLKVKK